MTCCCDCSAGCGRTGALCVIDYTWNLLKKQVRYFSVGTFFISFSIDQTNIEALLYWCVCAHFQILPPDFSIFNLVQQMRTQRPSLVQTKVATFSFKTKRHVQKTCHRKQHNHVSDVFFHVRCVPASKLFWWLVVCMSPDMAYFNRNVCFVVQPQEQYQLVYRTVKLLFEQYLQAMDAQVHRNAVSNTSKCKSTFL